MMKMAINARGRQGIVRWLTGRSAFLLLLPAIALLCAGAAQDQTAPPSSTPGAGQGSQEPELPDELRNPRVRGRDQRGFSPPRMVAGAMSLGGGDALEQYRLLEALIGEFECSGQTWRPDQSTAPLSGTWRNEWVLDGQYLQSTFELTDRSGQPMQALGMTWYNERARRFEATFYNSNSAMQTFRWGNFDEPAPEAAGDANATPDDLSSDEDDAAAAPRWPRTLTMLTRTSSQREDAEPISKIELKIVDVNEFHYIGYGREDGSDEWGKSFELVMKRVEPIDLESADG